MVIWIHATKHRKAKRYPLSHNGTFLHSELAWDRIKPSGTEVFHLQSQLLISNFTSLQGCEHLIALEILTFPLMGSQSAPMFQPVSTHRLLHSLFLKWYRPLRNFIYM